jgi:hypothetical protein
VSLLAIRRMAVALGKSPIAPLYPDVVVAVVDSGFASAALVIGGKGCPYWQSAAWP